MSILNENEKKVYKQRFREYQNYVFGPHSSDVTECKKTGEWDTQDLWIEKEWQKDGIVFMDYEHYEHYIGSKNGHPDKPWMLVMMKTPFYGPDLSTEGDNMLRKLRCFKKVHPEIGFGIMDYRGQELIKESFHLKMSSQGEKSAYILMIYGGKVYHATHAIH